MKHLSGVPLKCRLLTLPSNTRLGWKSFQGRNSLAYWASMKKMKCREYDPRTQNSAKKLAYLSITLAVLANKMPCLIGGTGGGGGGWGAAGGVYHQCSFFWLSGSHAKARKKESLIKLYTIRK
jgi:hypothetical protein